MSELSQHLEKSWLMIPFWTDPKARDYPEQVDKFSKFAAEAKEVAGLKLAVIDDGCGLSPERLGGSPDLFISLKTNQGKAQAIRHGLSSLLSLPEKPSFIVQYDGDGDQIARDIPNVRDRLLEVSQGDPTQPTLVIGNRYSEGLKTSPNPESIAYRQSLLIFFGALAKQITGADNVRDWVSGARGYTFSYADAFNQRSRADRYGVESEQLIIAGLVGATVDTARLTDSRPRDPWTLTSKWLQNFEIYSQHSQSLIDNGLNNVVDLVDDLVDNLKQNEPFTVDLSPIGESTQMRLWKWDSERHAAEIPAEYRAAIFETESDFPFTLRKVLAAS